MLQASSYVFFLFFFILVSALIKLFFTLSKVVKSSEYTNIQLTFTLSFFYFSHFRSFFCQPEHLYRWLLPCRWWCVSSVLITGCTWCRRTRACACVCVCVFAQIVNHLSITTRWKQPSQQGHLLEARNRASENPDGCCEGNLLRVSLLLPPQHQVHIKCARYHFFLSPVFTEVKCKLAFLLCE